MYQRKTILFFVLAIPLILAAGQPYLNTKAPSATENSYIGSEIPISERDSEEFSPAIAYNPNHNEYLVVWQNGWPGGHRDIYAQRVSASGQLLSWFAVSVNSNSQMAPSVAYDPLNDRYLVVWMYDVWGNGSDWDVYGRVIPWNGPDANLTDFMICNWNSHQMGPVVVYARAPEEFLVVWVNSTSGVPTYLSGRRVFAATAGFPPGDGFTISSGPESRDQPDVAYNLARNEYLVTWDVFMSGTVLDIYGVRLRADGVPLGSGEFPIAAWTAWEDYPSVAACHQSDQYLVAWQSYQDTGGSDYAIYARYLNGDGVPGNVYEVDDTTRPELLPEIGCNAAGREYLLAWTTLYTNGKYGIWARVAHPDESMNLQFEVIPPGSVENREFPAVAGGGSTYLVAWVHQRTGGTNRDIHARLLRYAVFLPMLKK